MLRPAGPAGISAAIYRKSRGKKALVPEKKQVGGMIGTVSIVTHYTAIVQEEHYGDMLTWI